MMGIALTKSGRFRADILCEGERLYLGSWPTAAVASEVYNDVAAFVHGEYAFTARAA
jgi:hypothetical protein